MSPYVFWTAIHSSLVIVNANRSGDVKEVSAKHCADRLHSHVTALASEESGTASKNHIWISAWSHHRCFACQCRIYPKAGQTVQRYWIWCCYTVSGAWLSIFILYSEDSGRSSLEKHVRTVTVVKVTNIIKMLGGFLTIPSLTALHWETVQSQVSTLISLDSSIWPIVGLMPSCEVSILKLLVRVWNWSL
jgi:hypothetical protein